MRGIGTQETGMPENPKNVSFVLRNDAKSELNLLALEFQPKSKLRGPIIQIKANDIHTIGLADSGAEISMIRLDRCKKRNLNPCNHETTLQWFEGTHFQTKGCVLVDLECVGRKVCVECVVVEQLSHQFLLGQDFFRAVGLTIDFGQNCYWSSKGKLIVKWPLLGVSAVDSDTSEDEYQSEKPIQDPEVEEKRRVLKSEFTDFLMNKPGFTDVLEHEIVLKEGTTPIKQKPYRLSPVKEKAALEQIPKMLAEGIIEESKWCSPVVMVPKPSSNEYRMCIDFRKLNARTIPSYPLNRIEKIMSKLHGAKIFAVLDIKSGYWQVSLRKEDRELTSFSIGRNLYQFKVLPFGVSNGPATFQRLVEKILKKRNCLGRICEVHIDDLIVFSSTWEEQDHLREVLTCLREAGMKASLEKSRFLEDSVIYLGLGVSEHGLTTKDEMVQAIVDYVAPRNRKELERFLGMCGWYAKFIPDYAMIAEPLNRLR
jgi:hypothetical protein